MLHIGGSARSRVRIYQCVSAIGALEAPTFVWLRSSCNDWLMYEDRMVCETRTEGFHVKWGGFFGCNSTIPRHTPSFTTLFNLSYLFTAWSCSRLLYVNSRHRISVQYGSSSVVFKVWRMEFLTLKRHLKRHLKLVSMSSCSIRAFPLYITRPVTVSQV